MSSGELDSRNSNQRSPLRKVSRNVVEERTPPVLGSAAKRQKAAPNNNDDDDIDLVTTTTTPDSTTTTPVETATPSPSPPPPPPPPTMIDYPEHVDEPSRALVQSLYEQAEAAGGDQKSTNAGLLSLQEVLLPAVAYQEDCALKKVQAYVQRDHPDQTGVLVLCRKAVYDTVGAAMTAVATSRDARFVEDSKREDRWAREKEVLLQQRKEECEMERIKRKNELVKKLPRNQALWREVVYLMTEMSKLQKEERMWKEAQENIVKRQEEFAIIEQRQQHEDETMKEEDNEMEEQTSEEMETVKQTVEDITLSATRIQQALDIVSDIATESDRVRKDLYRRYRRDQQFHGYQGIKDPKGLLRSLSQSQDID
jgi:hypothetical protein